MAEIVLKNIIKRFASLIAVNNLNLEIKNKEFVVLLGPSGCGKTTTLRMISGLELPDEGKILLDGEDVTFKRASQRDIAFVFQLYALYPQMTVYGNMSFPLRAQGYPKAKIDEEVNRAAELLKIKHILNKKPRELAGGDMQRVALGRALVRRPKVFLLDEPIGTLDAKFREEMRTELKRLHVDVGATTVYVTHDQIEAMSMGDKVVVMNKGILQQVDTPQDIYRYPKNLFVAKFIGSPGMNFIECIPFKDGNGKVSLKINAVEKPLSIPEKLQKILIDKGKIDKQIIFGVRPEDIYIEFKEMDNYLKSKVFITETLGSYNIIDIKLGKDTLRVRTLPTVTPDINTEAYIGFDMDRVSLFDKETENSIM
ncbi:MAG: ABC transporter ATP-binding protein [Actinobacteria bacterium]|nr:ABC transporter ATP-binding protein [Cyanobacteriota bacterium]MCL5772652.1 ABC transporter ATP-binding protein [Actinomycetota bacterium]